MIRSPRRAVLLAALLALPLGGCLLLPASGPRVGRPIDFRPSSLVQGRTTRADLVRALGQPAAVAAPGQYVEVPTLELPPLQGPSPEPGRTWVAQAEAWYALFPAHLPAAPSSRVYYWATASSWGLRFLMPHVVASWDFGGMEELWALVDEDTGLVVEVVRRVGG